MTKDIEILIAKFFDNTISNEEKSALIAWINQRDEHKNQFNQSRKIRQITHPPFNPENINVDAAEQLVLQRIRKKQTSSYKTIITWWQKIAAVLLIPMLLLSIYLLTNNRNTGTLQTSVQEVTALPGSRTKVNLPDGSEVWLNSGSTLSYPLAFDKKQRKTSLSGEGYFSINSDKNRPFYVSINGLDVMVTGTELNVEGYRGDSVHTVTLVNGKATIITGNKEQIPLQPNQRFSFNTHTREYGLNTVDAALYGKWKEGVLAFRDETLENVFKRISRTFNVDIRLKDAQLANHKYRATFEKESLQQILDLISLSAPIQYKHVKTTNNGITKEVIEVHPK